MALAFPQVFPDLDLLLQCAHLTPSSWSLFIGLAAVKGERSVTGPARTHSAQANIHSRSPRPHLPHHSPSRSQDGIGPASSSGNRRTLGQGLSLSVPLMQEWVGMSVPLIGCATFIVNQGIILGIDSLVACIEEP